MIFRVLIVFVVLSYPPKMRIKLPTAQMECPQRGQICSWFPKVMMGLAFMIIFLKEFIILVLFLIYSLSTGLSYSS